jgi:predicted DNA-binding transcriptional regulator AlpA
VLGEKTRPLNIQDNQSDMADFIRSLQDMAALPKLLYTEEEVAAMMSLSTSTIRNRYNPDGQWHDPNFPEPRSLDGTGEGRKAAIRWHRDDLQRWATNLPRVSEARQLNKGTKHRKPS